MSDEIIQKMRVLGGSILNSSEHINKFQAGVIMFSLSYGSAVVVLPHTVKELGIYMWMVMLLLTIILSWYSTQVINHASFDMYNEIDISEINDPYPDLANYCWGKTFQKVVTVTLYICHLTLTIGFILLASALLADIFDIGNITKTNKVRIWCLISVIVSSPFMFIGLYKDLVSTAYMAVATTTIGFVGVLLNSAIAKLSIQLKFDSKYLSNQGNMASIFRNYGILVFALSGPSYILPNVAGALPLKESIVTTISITFLLIFLLYIVAGYVPYLLFGGLIKSSITETFTHLMKDNEMNVPFHIILVIIQLTISFHLVFVAVLVMNPVFRNAEKYLRVKEGCSWQRVIIRSALLTVILIVCFLMPHFETVLSIVGALPLTLLAFIYPIVIHMKMFKLSYFHWTFSIGLLIFCVVMLFGNLYVAIDDIIIMYKSEGFLGLKTTPLKS